MREVQRDIGWVYRDLKWLSRKEARLANKERDALLKSLSNEVNYSFERSKIHTGKLSLGCVLCGEGYMGCIYINSLCTARCFFCTQDRKIKKERPPMLYTEDGEFRVYDPEDFLAYLKKFNFRGVPITGGECLLVYKKLLLYTRKIRERFGKKFYIWIYTNGDLVNENKLRKLKESGVDEIRFNIGARNYDLQPVKLATDIIDTVTVEIPAIPEDYEIVKDCLPKMQNIGVKYLNLHQLIVTEVNYKNFIKRGYTFLHNPPFSIFESEIVALKLMRYALDKKIGLPIHYCSKVYKNRFQDKAERRWKAPLVKSDFEELTDLKFIRRLLIQDSPANIKKIVKILLRNKCQYNLWSLNDTQTEIFIHSSLLKYIDFAKYSLTISYFTPRFRKVLGPDEVGKAIMVLSRNEVFITKELVGKQKVSNPATIKIFQKLFIENMDEQGVLNELYTEYGLTLNEWRKETELLLTLKTWERAKVGLPEVY